MKTIGRFETPAIFILSCQVPVAVAPSPQLATATIPELSNFDASAQPTATGAESGNGDTTIKVPLSTTPKWLLPSLPLDGPSCLPKKLSAISFKVTPFLI